MCGGVGLYGRSPGDCVARSAPPIPATAPYFNSIAPCGCHYIPPLDNISHPAVEFRWEDGQQRAPLLF